MKWDQAPAEAQRTQQNDRLHKFLNDIVAPFSAHYRRLFAEHKIDPRQIKTVADLRRIPFTTKLDLLPADGVPDKVREFAITPELAAIKRRPRVIAEALLHGRQAAERSLEREFRPIFLTATTGRSTARVSFVYTDHDLRNLREAGSRLIQVFGATTKMRGVNMFPYAPHLGFWQVVFAGFEFGMFLVGTGGGKVLGTEGNITVIEQVKPEAIIGMPTFVYHVLRQAHEAGKRWPQVSRIVLGGEKCPPGMRRKIVSLLAEMGASDVRVCTTYGLTEARMAWGECPLPPGERSGYHLFSDLGVFEVIDPATGAVQGEDEPGELVYTPLDARGSVVIRYRTGDYVDGGITWEPCPHCGRTVPRIIGNISRASSSKELQFDKIKGTIVNFDTLQHLLDDLPEVGEWQIELLKRDNDPLNVDELVLHFAPVAGVNREELERKIRARFQDETEITPNRFVAHSFPDMLQRIKLETSLKEVRVLDSRPKP